MKYIAFLKLTSIDLYEGEINVIRRRGTRICNGDEYNDDREGHARGKEEKTFKKEGKEYVTNMFIKMTLSHFIVLYTLFHIITISP